MSLSRERGSPAINLFVQSPAWVEWIEGVLCDVMKCRSCIDSIS